MLALSLIVSLLVVMVPRANAYIPVEDPLWAAAFYLRFLMLADGALDASIERVDDLPSLSKAGGAEHTNIRNDLQVLLAGELKTALLDEWDEGGKADWNWDLIIAKTNAIVLENIDYGQDVISKAKVLFEDAVGDVISRSGQSIGSLVGSSNFNASDITEIAFLTTENGYNTKFEPFIQNDAAGYLLYLFANDMRKTSLDLDESQSLIAKFSETAGLIIPLLEQLAQTGSSPQAFDINEVKIKRRNVFNPFTGGSSERDVLSRPAIDLLNAILEGEQFAGIYVPGTPSYIQGLNIRNLLEEEEYQLSLANAQIWLKIAIAAKPILEDVTGVSTDIYDPESMGILTSVVDVFNSKGNTELGIEPIFVAVQDDVGTQGFWSKVDDLINETVTVENIQGLRGNSTAVLDVPLVAASDNFGKESPKIDTTSGSIGSIFGF